MQFANEREKAIWFKKIRAYERILFIAGSKRRLAKSLDIPPSVVYGWAKKGVQVKYIKRICEIYGKWVKREDFLPEVFLDE